ncbi:uncharacterized protein N7483_007954 [Penicillium malachiteum]|uniref:uncharacterized protein n=1 Tax=Penicillium malachiteum TaxID=1324776 RepID=UPI0025476B8F|nr:uncharacterized protein N7483_007954 [Penicillium malachiteum]KAJ5726597.1 hypothetical protein N7483_007954 [Penicillium malachiteum]
MEDLNYVNGSYFPSWRIYRGQNPSSMNLAKTTHVFYAFLRVRSDGSIYHLDEKADLQYPTNETTGCLHAFRALRDQQFPHLKLIVSIGGSSGSQPFKALASERQSRRRLAQNMRQFVDQYKLNGVDVDWEHPSDPADGRNYVLLLEELRRSLPAPQYLLTTALPVGEWCLKHIDVAKAAEHVDFVNLMCYDFAGPWTGLSGHQSQLYAPTRPFNDFAKRSGHDAVKYFLARGVKSRKLVFGVPVYARSFLGVDGVGQRFTGHSGEGGTFEYRDLPLSEAKEFSDPKLGAAGSVGGEGGFLSYDLPSTVQMKAEYVRANNLGGLFYWTGVADDAGPRSLVSAGYDVLSRV